ncbi:MAG TPA: glycosyltransferase [Xanthobacteraceae bacterium]|nr:glycosyltransferase [Xanthobacteraceae bacterium]
MTQSDQQAEPEFDESGYLAANPDVASAVARGDIASGHAHWAAFGQSEGRALHLPPLPDGFDETDYLALNPDVEAAVATGEMPSGAYHWQHFGFREDRDWRLEKAEEIQDPDFDEIAYLTANIDAACDVADGVFSTGYAHWIANGRREGRALRPEMPAVDPERPVPRDRRDWLAILGRSLPQEHPLTADKIQALWRAFDAAGYLALYRDVGRLRDVGAKKAFCHWVRHGFGEGRALPGTEVFRRNRHATTTAAFTHVNYVGFLTETSGLAAAARANIAALRACGVDVRAIGIRHVEGGFRPDDPAMLEAAGDGINLFHINADHCLRFFLGCGERFLSGAVNIGIWAWELEAFPSSWNNCFAALDEIWVPSRFCERAIASRSPIPVRVMPHVVAVASQDAAPARDHFGIPDDAFLFSTIFDIGSIPERKNPLATIQAFKAAFGARSDVMLAVKCHGSRHAPDYAARLMAECDAPNIVVFDRIFDDAELAAFKGITDCFVSAHRSEGFGLNIAEAMLLGTPVIATGYSGNMDFMTPANSFPLRHRMVNLRHTQGPYPAGYCWAEPDVAHLRQLMLQVEGNRAGAVEKGRRAAEEMIKRYSGGVVGEAMLRQIVKLGFSR